MKVLDICNKYDLDVNKFRDFLINSFGFNSNIGILDMKVEDHDVDRTVRWFHGILTEEEKAEIEEKKAALAAATAAAAAKAIAVAEAVAAKNSALSEMLITSGFMFEGYRIKKYSGYISGDDCAIIPRYSFTQVADMEYSLCNALAKIKKHALEKLKDAAYNLGCNAVIELNFDYITIESDPVAAADGTQYAPYLICVTVRGNAVIIEKDE